MSKTDLWMPLYIGDYLGDTQRLTTEQHGAYLLLMMDYWRHGPPPDDDRVLASITKLELKAWKLNRPTLERMFQVEQGAWHHKRIDRELGKAGQTSDKRKMAGAEGAKAKWGDTTDADNRATRSQRLAEARAKGRHTSMEWEELVAICNVACVRCDAAGPLVKDHITPIYQAGSDGIENIQPLCRSCNSSKGPDRTDYRPSDWRERLAERLAKRLANARQTPRQSQSQLSSLRSDNIVVVDARAGEPCIAAGDWIALTDEVCRVAGVRHVEPGRVVQNGAEVQRWLALGITADELLDVIRQHRADMGSQPVTTLRAFDQKVRAHISAKEAKANGITPNRNHRARSGLLGAALDDLARHSGAGPGDA